MEIHPHTKEARMADTATTTFTATFTYNGYVRHVLNASLRREADESLTIVGWEETKAGQPTGTVKCFKAVKAEAVALR
jgi:hypothetical protein